MKSGAKPSDAIRKGYYRSADGSIKQYSEEMMAKAEACRQRIQKAAVSATPHAVKDEASSIIERERNEQAAASAQTNQEARKGYYRTPDGSIKQYSEEMMAKAEACRRRLQQAAVSATPDVINSGASSITEHKGNQSSNSKILVDETQRKAPCAFPSPMYPNPATKTTEPKQQPGNSATAMPPQHAARKGYYKTPDGSIKQYSEDFMNRAEAARQRILNAASARPLQQSTEQREIEIRDLEQSVATELANPGGDITHIIRSYVRRSEIGNGEAAFQLAQFYRIDHIGIKKDLNLAVDYYMKAARMGHQKALIPLETLCEEMNKQKKLALSHLYGSIFNHEKADIWHKKSTETEQLNLLM